MVGGDEQLISLQSFGLDRPRCRLEFYSGEYIHRHRTTRVNFTVHVTGVPHGCEGGEQSWDAQQRSTCPTRISNHRDRLLCNFQHDVVERRR